MVLDISHWMYGLKQHKIRDQKGLWVNSFLRQLAFALVSMFSVIFIFSMGKEMFGWRGVVGGLELVLVYLATIRLVVLVGVVAIGNYVIRKIGYRRSVMISLVATSLAFGSLSAASISGVVSYVVVAAILMGLGVCGYWPVWYAMVPDDAKESEMGTSFGMLLSVATLGQVVAPLLAAWVVIRFGYDWLFLLGIGFLLASGAPMFFLKHHAHYDEVSWGEFGRWSKDAVYRKAGAAIGGMLVNGTIYENFWPIYVLVMVGGLGEIGVLRSVVLLASAVFTYLVAQMFDKSKTRKWQMVGVGGGVIFWVMRLLVSGFMQVVVVDSLDRFFATLSGTYFHGYAFRRAKGKETFSFAVYWLVWESIASLFAYGLLTAVLLVGGVGYFWATMVVLAAVGLILSMLMNEHHKQFSI